MANTPIHLGIKRTLSRQDDNMAADHDQVFRAIRPSILKRDNNTCGFCGIRATKLQDIHHIDGRQSNNSEANLITSCRMCHLCHHIGYVGLEGIGLLIYLPQISQGELNHLVRALWIGENSFIKDISSHSVALLRTLTNCAAGAKQLLGSAEPKLLAEYLGSLSNKDYAMRTKYLSGIRLLYHRDSFEDHISVWKDEVFSAYPVKHWNRHALEFAERLRS